MLYYFLANFFSHCVSTAFHQQAVHSPLEQQKGQRQSGPVPCQNCGKPCKGEVLRVQNKHFHIKCFVCKGNASITTPLNPSIYYYCVEVFRQLYNGFYPKGILKGALNVELLEPEHKTNVMKTSRYFVVQHYTLFTLTNSIILSERGGWSAYCYDSGLPQPLSREEVY